MKTTLNSAGVKRVDSLTGLKRVGSPMKATLIMNSAGLKRIGHPMKTTLNPVGLKRVGYPMKATLNSAGLKRINEDDIELSGSETDVQKCFEFLDDCWLGFNQHNCIAVDSYIFFLIC